MHATLPLLRHYGFPAVRRKRLETLQVNIGYRCNQSCVHCHVSAGPQRTEMMAPEVIEEVVAFLPQVETLDITGGAPELHPQFRSLVSRARSLGKHVIDRCNLTSCRSRGRAISRASSPQSVWRSSPPCPATRSSWSIASVAAASTSAASPRCAS